MLCGVSVTYETLKRTFVALTGTPQSLLLLVSLNCTYTVYVNKKSPYSTVITK